MNSLLVVAIGISVTDSVEIRASVSESVGIGVATRDAAGIWLAAVVANGINWTSLWNTSVEPIENMPLPSQGIKWPLSNESPAEIR
jgi:hypothetical protein